MKQARPLMIAGGRLVTPGGVISGTLLAVILARRLDEGDPDGHMRRALAQLPLAGVAERVLERHFVPGGREPGAPFQTISMPSLQPNRALNDLMVAANFVVAVAMVHFAEPFRGWWPAIVLVFLGLHFAAAGSGKFGLDALFGGRGAR